MSTPAKDHAATSTHDVGRRLPVVFGAFDRHNLGDILLAHVAARQSGSHVYAGLAAGDLTPFGGQRVLPVKAFSEPIRLIHAGGELLDCDAEQAATMLARPELRWPRRAPYVVARRDLPAGSSVEFRAVGGVEFARRDPAFRAEVLAALRQAERVSVRDQVTRGTLAESGVDSHLERDPVSGIATLFGNRIRSRLRKSDPYIAMQFAAECGDDASLAAFARGLRHIGLRIVLFRAGAAPWHDDLEPYRRLAALLGSDAAIDESLDVWNICALIAGSRGYVGTSLHCRIVAESFAVPALSLERRRGAGLKLRAYLSTWNPGELPLDPDAFADGAWPDRGEPDRPLHPAND